MEEHCEAERGGIEIIVLELLGSLVGRSLSYLILDLICFMKYRSLIRTTVRLDQAINPFLRQFYQPYSSFLYAQCSTQVSKLSSLMLYTPRGVWSNNKARALVTPPPAKTQPVTHLEALFNGKELYYDLPITYRTPHFKKIGSDLFHRFLSKVCIA